MNEKVDTVAKLGEIISKTRDFATCLASRYYEYFTGVSVDIAQIHNDQSVHKARIEKLTDTLTSTQNPRAVVREILKSSYFRQHDFGAGD